MALLLLRGATDRQISRELGVSERTVSAEVRELGRRLGATNRAHAIARICGVSRLTRAPGSARCSEAQAAELLGVALPVLGDLDVQVEVHPLAEQRLDAGARVRADLAQA